MDFKLLASDQQEMVQHAFEWGCSSVERRARLFEKNEHYCQMYMSLSEQSSFGNPRPVHPSELLKHLKSTNNPLYLTALKMADIRVIVGQLYSFMHWKDRRVVLETVERHLIPSILEMVDEPICKQIISHLSSKARAKHLKALSDVQLAEWEKAPEKIGGLWVATDDFVSELGDPAQKCEGCSKRYEEGEKLSFTYCTKHTFHLRTSCQSKECSCVNRRPLFRPLFGPR